MTEQEIGCKANKQYCFNCHRGIFGLLVWSFFLDKCLLPSSADAPILELPGRREAGEMALLRRGVPFCLVTEIASPVWGVWSLMENN